MMKYSYHDFDRGIKNILQQILDNETFDVDLIVGLSRGGLIPGVKLSHLLGVPFYPIDYPRVDNSVGAKKPKVDKIIPDKLKQGLNILVVDDIVDEGTTMNELIYGWIGKETHILEQIRVAVLVYNESQEYPYAKATYYDKKINRAAGDTAWVDFWWESNFPLYD